MPISALEAGSPSGACSFLAHFFPVFPVARPALSEAIFHNRTGLPSASQPLGYPTAEALRELLYHSRRSPYHGMAPIIPPGATRPRRGMQGLSFSFAAKYGHHIRRHVEEILDAPARFIVEVGAFHGASATQTWAPMVTGPGRNGTVLCVDTWQGDLHMRLEAWGKGHPLDMRIHRSAPHILDVFMQNVVDRYLEETIYPFPLPSIVAARFLATTAWKIDLIYVDSAHERGETLIELHLYFQLLRPGGLLMGDDYQDFPAVRADVDEFAHCQGLQVFSQIRNTWAIHKPLDAPPTPRGPLGVPGARPPGKGARAAGARRPL